MESAEIESRSPFSTETDTFYCLEVPVSVSHLAGLLILLRPVYVSQDKFLQHKPSSFSCIGDSLHYGLDGKY